MPDTNKEITMLKERIAELETEREHYITINNELLTNEQEWQALFDVLPVSVVAVREDNSMKRYNTAFKRMFGFLSETEFCDDQNKFYHDGVRFYDNNDNEVSFLQIPGVRALHENKVFNNAEIGAVLNDGKRIWMSVNATPLPGTGVVVSGIDITSLKEHQIALSDSRRKYIHLLNTIPYGVVETDCDGYITYTNTGFSQILECEQEEILGKSLYGFLYPEYGAKDLKNLLDNPSLFSAGSASWFGSTKTPGGSIKNITIDWNHSIDEKENLTGFIMVVTDTTETKHREEIHDIITQNAQESICILDENGRAIFMNQPAMQLTGGTIGKSIWDVFPEKFSGRLIDEIRDIFHKGNTRSGELKVPLQDKTLWMHVSRVPVKNSIGQVISILIIATDITELKLKEQQLLIVKGELEKKADNLKEINIALKVLLENRNDEIKNIYETISNSIAIMIQPFLEMLKRNADGDLQKSYLDIIDANLNELTTTFPSQYRDYYSNFTTTEIQVAKLISSGKTTKDIMELLNISENTVTSHRKHIRKKLGLSNKKKNLMTFLQHMESQNLQANR